MPASWLAALNTALPYLESLAKVALPVFGQRKQAGVELAAAQRRQRWWSAAALALALLATVLAGYAAWR